MLATRFLLLFALLPICLSQTLRGGVLIDCGADVGLTIRGLEWLPDSGYISAGSSKIVAAEGLTETLHTVRSFPLQNNVFKKFCYEVPVDRTRKYLVRTTYYYGGVNGNANPPVFDQIVDGTLWSVVNTTEDYMRQEASYYEGIFMPTGKNLSVCVAGNTYTDSDPFISALEVVLLWDQLYNSTDFRSNALSLVARHSFGYDGPVFGYPDDQFNRYWEPFGADAFPLSNPQELAVSGIWNLPPPKVFHTRLSKSLVEPLTLPWPPGPLPGGVNYYIALYFADDHASDSNNSRAMDITINGVPYYSNLIRTPVGLVVFSNQWPLAGFTNLTLTPAPGSTAGPLINAGEVYQVLPAGAKTLPRDVIAMIDLRTRFHNPPADWRGDPCLPSRYTWTGVTCSYGPRIRVVSLNLTSMGLSGSISPSISRLTALSTILLGNNSLSGTIPNLSSLKGLQILHLQDNRLGGTIPPSLGDLQTLRELFLQNNNLTGRVPINLAGKQGLNLR
ncbi:probable LRR receptor-like serine/threonine-protein kinase At1g67720 isoform X2 [Salvia miltiorrhiza]|uniref:probable LRR receptor-like serine/threonine-protein kinase At1g67720 isoform X2 n=1 Tax=Salvia miltiorrhiza TaxID=226208 RepID=UPI0025ABAA01|nr:probable LRR receptor-like serine/threonine-protein kinase At1g67720 isoform X2 [Salvia miltiorrhiza]